MAIGQGAENFLRDLKPQDFVGRDLGRDEFEGMFETAGAIWTYKGDPSSERPHAQLTSGKCSNSTDGTGA